MKFLLDTSVVRGHLRILLDKVTPPHKLFIPALARTEHRFQHWRRINSDGTKNDTDFVRGLLDRHPNTLDVIPFTATDAEAAADRMVERFRTDREWLLAKRDVVWKCCGNSVTMPEISEKRDCGAPVDLFLAALATPDFPIITCDNLFEWHDWSAGCVLNVTEALERMGI